MNSFPSSSLHAAIYQVAAHVDALLTENGHLRAETRSLHEQYDQLKAENDVLHEDARDRDMELAEYRRLYGPLT